MTDWSSKTNRAHTRQAYGGHGNHGVQPLNERFPLGLLSSAADESLNGREGSGLHGRRFQSNKKAEVGTGVLSSRSAAGHDSFAARSAESTVAGRNWTPATKSSV